MKLTFESVDSEPVKKFALPNMSGLHPAPESFSRMKTWRKEEFTGQHFSVLREDDG